ncbi:MAG: Coenzyme F420 hydrogenase/dehydrogenase, beta subunit C-terminal domain, partial [Prevotella sp.]|nr:Coenzyme F420 hydrogenase/dehydrogenase, beta subunit C-terminal domain [Candidatus Equicola stercoris]
RKSCYHCNRILRSEADFSIGDFWGINEYNPKIDDNRGYSYIKINNSDMVKLFKELTSENCFLEELPEKAMLYQYHERNKKKKLDARNIFFENVNKMGYIKAIDNHYGKYNIIKSVLIAKCKDVVKSIIGKHW